MAYKQIEYGFSLVNVDTKLVKSTSRATSKNQFKLFKYKIDSAPRLKTTFQKCDHLNFSWFNLTSSFLGENQI